MAIRVFVVNDAPLYREGLAHVLGKFEDLSVVGTASDAHEVLSDIPDQQPDVILVQLTIPGSAATLRAIVDIAPDAKVVVLGVPNSEKDILACAEAGASGYLLHNESLDDLVVTIRAVACGEVLCSPRIAASLLRRVAELAAGRGSWAAQAHLTYRESEIVDLIDRGLSNKEIAQCLSIEVRTVKNHVHNLLDKLQVHRRGEAAARVREGRSLTRQKPGPPNNEGAR